MAFAAVSYPTLSEPDLQWIQEIRKKHDRLFYKIVDPHFTFVFPTESIDRDSFSKHIIRVSASFNSFPFTCWCVTIGDPDFLDHAHVFMIPDEGFSEIVKLHDALYTDLLKSELRLDLPFVPHIGIASYPGLEKCKEIVDELNQQDFEIRGSIDTLDIIEFDGKTVKTIEQIHL